MPRIGLELFDPRNGDLALKIQEIARLEGLGRPQRSNYFSVFWVQKGSGTFWADTGSHPFPAGSLLFVVPYQSFRIESDSELRGVAIQFHANFFCMETHHEEVGCNGVLFNDTYGVPVVRVNREDARELRELVEKMRAELVAGELAHPELLVSYLKIFLIKAVRLKMRQQEITQTPAKRPPPILAELRQLIEEHHRTIHAPAAYAKRLHVTPKALAKVVKTHLHKTVTSLIQERLLRQAKWDLLHTPKPVKQIAAELGFEDPFYFSRLFKRTCGCSPLGFREFETEIRGGRNLSMR